MEKRTLILAAVAASSLAMLAERRYSMSEKIRDEDEDVFDRIFNEPFPGDYIIDVGPAYDIPYGRIDREDIKITPEFFLADRPAPDYGSLRAQIGARIRGHQVLEHRKPVRRRS